MAAPYSLGIDIGGTFTDVVIIEELTGRLFSVKVLTTPSDPAIGAMAGVTKLLTRTRLAPHDISRVVHATTLFTNALIERKGAKTGLITTKGFRDTLEIGRERKFELYDLNIAMPTPLVPRNLRLEVNERTTHEGVVLRSVSRQELLAKVVELKANNVESIAIAFINSYRNSRNEQDAISVIQTAFPELTVATSSDVANEIREFERTSTTVANAYVKPLASRYLQNLSEQLERLGIKCSLSMMISNGGFTHVLEAKRTPIQLLESGPAAGALAAAYLGKEREDLLGFDMGGTTAKLALIESGAPLVKYGFEAARQKRFLEGSGLPIQISTIELIEIGAGGGSIAYADELELLKVGPQSAGADPGPACYGLGGQEPTVTDANLLLGYLNPDYFAGGQLKIHIDKASAALDTLASRFKLRTAQVTWGIHDIVNENMASAARVHIAERGRDPRTFALLTTGGGGPVHGYHVARKLGIRQLICPPSAGVASAIGLLAAPARVDRVATVMLEISFSTLAKLERHFAELENHARKELEAIGSKFRHICVGRFADARFAGQGFYLPTELPKGPYAKSNRQVALLCTAFKQTYSEKFSKTPPDVPIEFVNIRVTVTGALSARKSLVFDHLSAGRSAIKGMRKAFFGEVGRFVNTKVYDRHGLPRGYKFKGPALVEDEGSTLVLGTSASARVARSGNIIVDLT
jgi:N-methylhydantoinase A